MLIDWFTTLAQIVNFLVLVIALKLLLFDRIVAVMDEREERIGSRLKEAEESRAQAKEEADRLRDKTAELDRQREQFFDEARRDAGQRRADLIEEAGADVAAMHESWLRALGAEKDRFLRELARRSGEQVYEVSRRALSDLADVELEDRFIGMALTQLGADTAKDERAIDGGIARKRDGGKDRAKDGVKDDNTKGGLAYDALLQARGPVIVRTAFPVSADRKEKIRGSLSVLLARDAFLLSFEEDPALICGLELRAGGYAVSWSIADYLDALAGEFSDLFRESGQIKID